MLFPEQVYILVIIILLYLCFKLSEFIFKLRSKNKSQSVLHGNKIEQFMPFMKNYPYNPENFKFLGKPVDGISFNEKEIVFVEFKTGNSQLSKKQRCIQDLIDSNQVVFKEIKI